MRKFLVVALVLLAPASVSAEKFTRQVKQGDKTVALEVPTIHMSMKVGNKTVKVALFGEVHIADKIHYMRRNIRFEQLDKLFFELVSDTHGQRPTKTKGGVYGIVSFLLELDSQMAVVDYRPKNFVHADMTKGELTKEMRKNGDTPITLIMDAILSSMRKQNKTVFALEDQVRSGKLTIQQARQQLGGVGSMRGQADLMTLLTDPNRAVKLKRMMAASFESSGNISDALGPVVGGYLIDKRNAKCIEIFQTHMKADLATDKGTNYGIYYGAAHLEDLEKRLKSLGFTRTKKTWTRAWDNLKLRKSSGDPVLDLLQQLQKLKSQLEDQ